MLKKASWAITSTAAIFLALQSSFYSFLPWPTLVSIGRMPALAIALNFGLICFVLWALRCLTKRAALATALCSLPTVVFSLVNYHKYALTGEPFTPRDLWEANHVDLLLNYVAPLDALAIAVAFGATAFELSRRRRADGSRPLRRLAPLAAGGLAMILSLGFARELGLERWLGACGVSKVEWDQAENFRVNGLPLGTLLSLTDELIPAPKNYDREHVLSLLRPDAPPKPRPQAPASDQPHVIIYMMESLWDPLLLPLQFDRDPMPTFRRLQREGQGGALLVPVYGGGTANTEFEVLTGLSTYFQPPGTVPFVQYLDDPVGSLAGLFKENGYRAVAVHNYNRRFYHRDRAYPMLGFEDFYSIEQMGPHAYRRGYPTDDVLVRKLTQLISEATGPLFIHAVSMETHGPYDIRLPHDTISLEHPALPAGLAAQTETYSSSLWYADQSLDRLSRALAALPRKVVLIAFGDHLPALGQHYGTYVASGFLSKADSTLWSPKEWRKMRTTPLLIWSNHPEQRKHAPPGRPLGTISANCLGNEILRQAGIQPDRFHRFSEAFCERIPLLSPEIMVDRDSRVLQSGKPPEGPLPQAVLDYQMLDYDRLLGNRYSAEHDPR